jgi:hypothetical protein
VESFIILSSIYKQYSRGHYLKKRSRNVRIKDGDHLLRKSKTEINFYDMNHQRWTSHDDSLRAPSNHGIRDEILSRHPSDVVSIHSVIRSEEEELQSSEEKQLALQHNSGRCTENDDLRSAMEKKSVLVRNYAVERASSLHDYLSQHSQHSSDRMTQMLSDANLAAYQVENTNIARSDSYSRRTIDPKEQDLYATTNRTDQHHQYTNVSSGQQTPKSSVDGYSRRTIEISPGVHVRLRGAEETWDCIGRDFFIPCLCFGCSVELCCIQDADYVLCPKCRAVSPMDTTSYGSESANAIADASSGPASTAGTVHEGGIGLGFTFDDLMKWQAENIQGRDFLSGNGF